MTEGESVKKSKLPKILLIVLIILVVVLVAAGSYLYFQYKKNQELLKNPTLAAQIESQKLIESVGKLIELPKDEQPTIATVSDMSKLKDQPFFSKAKNGDKVLIYTKAQKAILYNPEENKIVEVGPVNIGAQNNTTSKQSTPVKLALYNSTTTTGLTTKIEKELRDSGLSIDVVERTNSSSTSAYAKTLVVDLSGKQTALANQISSILNGQVGKLPENEKKPKEAEILVILGKE